VGASITLTDAATGGTWSASNTNATVVAGVVTGATTGVDTISYTVTNSCGTDIATKTITVNPLPNAGTITGLSVVCVGSSITLTDAAAGGTWSASNTHATVAAGVVTGSTTGIDTISYTVTNSCGTDIATKTITVNPLPYAGTITGTSRVCVGSFITLANATTGGTWGATNTNATITSAALVTGVAPGLDTISYSITNSCGTAVATMELTVNAQPLLTSNITPAAICDGAAFNYSPVSDSAIASFSWSRAAVAGISNTATTGTGAISEALMNTTSNPQVVTYVYTTTANGCSTTQGITVTVNPTPKLSSPLAISVCSGSPVVYIATGFTTGSTFTWNRAPVTNILPNSGTGVGDIHETLTSSVAVPVTVVYAFTSTANGCSFNQNVVLTVNPLPVTPVITTNSPSAVCANTLYQNFGTTAPPAGTAYHWSAVNATIWAASPNGQNALVSFPATGAAQVMLTTSIYSLPCTVSTNYAVNVGTQVSTIPTVRYFEYHFVCTPNNEGSYQWGYDNVTMLDSTILPGEVNQDYLNASPDFANKYYWVMTSNGGCNQKTYFRIPTAIEEVNATATTIAVYPNPTTDVVNVTINSATNGTMQVTILNMAGQEIVSVPANDNKASINVANLASGVYMVCCYRDGVKVGTSRFIKN
jgi:hypothetical protein